MKFNQFLPTVLFISFSQFFLLNQICAQTCQSIEDITTAGYSIFEYREDKSTPGASVIIMRGEEVLVSKNYGQANLSFGAPFNKNTVFPLAGFTEQLVVFSIFRIEKRRMTDLDSPVNKYLPELGFSDQVT